MRINRVIHRYYEDKLEEIEEISFPVVPLKFKAEQKSMPFSICWSELFGYLLMVGVVLHFLLGGKLFDMVRLFPGFTILF